MTTKIYFFSGTGNSLNTARELCNQIEDCSLFSISKEYRKEKFISDCKKVGFVFPLYYAGLPKIVFDFVQKLDVTNVEYIFTVITYAGDITNWPSIQLDQILKEKSRRLNAAYFILMPNNYIIGYDVHSEKRQKTFFEKASQKTNEIIKNVKNKIDHIDLQISNKSRNRLEKFNREFREKVNQLDKSFLADEKCTECGICEQVCPVNNIKLIEGEPSWRHNCQLCLACINYCPEKAIQYGNESQAFGRYYHPKVSVKDIKNQ